MKKIIKSLMLWNFKIVVVLNILGFIALICAIFVLEQGSKMQAHFFAASFFLLFNWVLIGIVAGFAGLHIGRWLRKG